jgi:hypothetical protein
LDSHSQTRRSSNESEKPTKTGATHGGVADSNSKLGDRALGRLVIMQRSPRQFGERRTEHIELKDNRHYAVRVDQQFNVPSHGDGGTVEKDLLIPLGEFAKDRLPDLIVTGPDGERLPVLSRAARGEVVATLFTSRWQHVVFANLYPPLKELAKPLWEIIQLTITRIVTRPYGEADRLIRLLDQYLTAYCQSANTDIAYGVESLKANPDFWTGLKALAISRLLVAKFQGVPGQTYVLTITYTESLRTDSYGSSYIRGLLAWLGLIAIPISRQAANCGQAASFWTVASAPPGVEILRLFWQSDRDLLPGDDSISIDASRAQAGRYDWSSDAPEENELLIDVQIAPSASVMGTIGLALILLYVSRYVYQGFPRLGSNSEERTILVGLGTLLVTIPATIAGALAYKGELFSRYASRGPRVMVAVLSALGALLAVAVSLKGITSLAEDTAYVVSVYCVFVIGIFGYIQVGFRWRNNDAARMRKWRKKAPPDQCRKKQTRAATKFFIFLIAVVIVFARCQVVLQHGHFFTPFPRELWHAWWSWFGL